MPFKRKINKILEEIQQHTINLVNEMNKSVQELKIGIEEIKKSNKQKPEGITEMQNVSKSIRTTDASITSTINNGRISDIEDTIEEMDTPVKENVKSNKFLT
jgi:methyl-accepting chemotaxis protein